MSPSLRAMLTEVIDYAGLFPPAQLELQPALRTFAALRGQPEAWMLGRFVCPAARLGDLETAAAELGADGPPLRVSAVGTSGDNRENFCTNYLKDLAAMDGFDQRLAGRGAVEVFEVRLPADWAGSNRKGRFFRRLVEHADEHGHALRVPSFFELPLDGDWRAELSRVAENLADFNGDAARREQPPFGLKLRCGALDAAAIPTAEQVASVIEVARDAEVPLKFTAGLHHPLRRHDHGLRAQVHGFVNVFAAGVLAYALGLEHHDIRAIVEEESAKAFSFSDEFLGWNEAEATISEINYARKHRVIAFGSCSFDEPRQELQRLGWL